MPPASTTTIATSAKTDIRPGVVSTSLQKRAARRRTGWRGWTAVPDSPLPPPAPGRAPDAERPPVPGPEPGVGVEPLPVPSEDPGVPRRARVRARIASLTSPVLARRADVATGVCPRLVK